VAIALCLALLAGACGGGETDPTGAGRLGPTATPAATPGPAVPSAADFTVDYSCGYGFWASDADQTMSLLIQFVDVEAAAAGKVPPVGNVPSVIWSGRAHIGADLMANWCDDVIEEGEPVPEITETWTVVDGAIEIHGTPPVQDCAPLAATITGIVLESAEGDTVSFTEPVEFENRAWGCFAG
jgi:hypothetical protein